MHKLITTISAVLLIGCSNPLPPEPAPQSQPEKPVAKTEDKPVVKPEESKRSGKDHPKAHNAMPPGYVLVQSGDKYAGKSANGTLLEVRPGINPTKQNAIEQAWIQYKFHYQNIISMAEDEDREKANQWNEVESVPKSIVQQINGGENNISNTVINK